ncbi:antibiotic biosynthesis monooxygenase, partial [Candidatus Magnetoovum chiemensis]
MLTVKAVIKAKEGKEELVKNELIALLKPTRLEYGCINYDLHRSINDDAVY